MHLTDNEIKVFGLLVNTSFDNGGDFGFTDEVDHDTVGINGRSFAGIVGSLVKKDLIAVEDGQFAGQYQFCCESIEVFKQLGLNHEKHDHLINCEII